MATAIVSRDVQQYTEAIPLDHIAVSGNNPREEVEDEDFAGLKADLASNGLINPIMVRPVGNPDSSRYEVVCGHRRFEAAKQLGWPSIRCTVRSMNDAEAFDLMGVENIQRRSFSPVEELAWLSKAIANAEARGEKQKDFAARIGRTPSWVSNKLRVSKAPQELLDYYAEGKLQDKHVLVLLSYHPYPKLYDELMEVIDNILEDGGSISASEIEDEAFYIIRVGGNERLALPIDPLVYEFKDLQPYWNQDGLCPGRKCGKVKIIERDGKSIPFCLDKECWERKLQEARERKEKAKAPAKAEQQPEGKVQKCHVLSCGNDTLPGKFWCEEHMDPMKRMAAPPNPEPDLEVAFANGQEAGREQIASIQDEWTNEQIEEHIRTLEKLIKEEEANENQDKRRKEYIALVKGQLHEVRTWYEGRKNQEAPHEFETPQTEQVKRILETGTESAPSADKPEASPEDEEEMEAQSEVLPVNAGAPATVCRCRICGGEIAVKDRAQATRDMVEHLLLNRDKERHNRAVQKFISGLLNNEGLARLEAYFVLPQEEQPEIYHECRPKDRGVMAKNIEQARAMLECDKCKNRKCKGPEVE